MSTTLQRQHAELFHGLHDGFLVLPGAPTPAWRPAPVEPAQRVSAAPVLPARQDDSHPSRRQTSGSDHWTKFLSIRRSRTRGP